MIHRDVRTLPKLGNQIQYIDALSGDIVTAIVGRVQQVAENSYFVFAVSPYKDENDKQESDGFVYRDIVVFDDQPEEIEGWRKDFIRAQYEKKPE